MSVARMLGTILLQTATSFLGCLGSDGLNLWKVGGSDILNEYLKIAGNGAIHTGFNSITTAKGDTDYFKSDQSTTSGNH